MSDETKLPPIWRLMVAELIGTFILIFFGLGAVHAAVLAGAHQGLWQVAIVWGLAIMVAIYAIGSISGAHINPAITVAMTLFRRFPVSLVGPYILAQLAGSILAAACLFYIFEPHLAAKELQMGVQRGEPGSVVTAMCYGEYFPNLGSLAAGTEPYSTARHAQLQTLVTHRLAFAAELLGTLMLAFAVFAFTDERNRGRPVNNLAPVFIGLTVAALISVIAPLTQACFNPARDFGPRLFAYAAGWGEVAIPGLEQPYWLTVYIIAPLVGAILGGAIYDLLVRPPRSEHLGEELT